MKSTILDKLRTGRFFSRFYIDLGIFLRLRKPRLLLRIAANYFRILVLRRRLLRTVDFAPSYACNMDCQHCFAAPLEDPARSASRMTPEDFARVAREAKSLGALHFAFQGGEPALLADLERLIEAVGPADSLVSITTNGSLLDEARLRRLKRAGLDMITVSIDSGFAPEHDEFRRFPGAHAKALRAVRLAKEQGLLVTVNTTVTHQGLSGGGFDRIVRLCGELGVKLNVIYPAISGKLAAGSKDVLLSQEERDAVRKVIESHPYMRRDLDANYHSYGCGAVKEMIYISPYGDVMPCSYVHVLLGNIRTDSLSSCVEKGLRIPQFSGYYPVCPPMEDMAFIEGCQDRVARSRTLPAPFHEVFPG